jgi:hypothetical protein
MAAISSIIGAIGLGTQIIGGIMGSSASSEAAGIQKQIAIQERLANEQRHKQMVLNSRRQQLEIVRNSQRARALALNNAVNQGAQFGSGLPGGQGQITSQEGNNLLSNYQNTQIGQNLFGIDSTISDYKMQLGQTQSDMATAQGIQSLGGALLKSAPTIGNITQGFNLPFSSSTPMNTYGGFVNGINSNGIY